MRLRRSDTGRPGLTRRRRGKGFSYLDEQRAPVTDRAVLARLRDLAIPPAWRDVWICPDPRGHLQATGVDAAGRRQYLYHPVWRAKRDAAKFDHVLEVAERLPELRRRVNLDLDSGRGLTRPRVLATVARLLDMGMFRVGSVQYATGEDPSYGLSTLRPEHVRGSGGCVVLEFTAKGGIEQIRTVGDPDVCAVLRDLRRRRRDSDRLFGWWDAAARQWHDVTSDEVNGYLRDAGGTQMSAKDFRTWHGTVCAATQLHDAGWHRSQPRRRRAVAAVMRSVSELLGNTPAVARASYVDPRVVDLYHSGEVCGVGAEAPRDTAEKAVVELLRE
jgi:DNA topoisomerase IB